MVGGIDRYFADYVNERDFGTDIDVQVGPDLGPAIREAYNPCFHGEVNTYYCSKEEGKINSRWKRHMVLLGIEALLVALVLISGSLIRKDIDTMLEFEKKAKQHNIDPKILAKMIKVAPEIVKHMSSESRVYFDMLMDGTLDCESNPVILGMATSILEGHLLAHPEDMKKVLAVFDEQSLPDSVKKYMQHVR